MPMSKGGSKKSKQGGVAAKTSQISQLQKKHGSNSRYQQQRSGNHNNGG